AAGCRAVAAARTIPRAGQRAFAAPARRAAANLRNTTPGVAASRVERDRPRRDPGTAQCRGPALSRSRAKESDAPSRRPDAATARFAGQPDAARRELDRP